MRIEIEPADVRLLGPSSFRDALRIRKDVHAQLIAAGLEMGAAPADWRAVAEPVPLTVFRRIEFAVETDPPLWIPWPGFRPRSS